MFQDELKIVKERVAVLIGKKGVTKKRLENLTETRIQVSKEGDVIISGDDGLKIYDSKNIITAIGRGFNPEIAEELLNEDYVMESVDVSLFSKKSKKKMIRLKGRVIGEKGKARNVIENLTRTNISVYGKRISVIGKIENAALAKHAVEALLRGSPHGNVYTWLERRQKELKRKEIIGEE